MLSSKRDAMSLADAAYQELYGTSLDLDLLTNELLIEFGVDKGSLCSNDIKNALRNKEPCNWEDMQFACTSLMASYSCTKPCANNDFMRSLAALLILSNCIKRNHGDWDRSLTYILGILGQNSNYCSSEVILDILRYSFCAG